MDKRLRVILLLVALVGVHCHGGHEENVAKPDREHIKEHLKDEAQMDTSKMTEDELEFYHFKLHDSDNNTSLDGLEVFKAITHQTEEMYAEPQSKEVPPARTYQQMMEDAKKREKNASDNVDTFFKSVDKNDDGYITFVEYKVHMQQFREHSPPTHVPQEM